MADQRTSNPAHRAARIFDAPRKPARRLTSRRKSEIQAMSMTYNLQERLNWSCWGEAPQVQDWQVTVRNGGAWVASIEIVRPDVLDDPYDLVSAVDQIDGSGGTMGHVVSHVLSDSSYPISRLISHGNGGNGGSNILILDEIMTEPAWDGLGLTAMLAGTALRRLTNDTLFIVTEPVPWWVKGKARKDALPGAHRFCESIGFVPYKKGIWVHWLAPGDLEERVDALRRRFGVEGIYEGAWHAPLTPV